MSATDRVTPEPRRFAIRMSRQRWIGVAVVGLVVVAIGMWTGVRAYRRYDAVMWENHEISQNRRRAAEFSGLTSHPLDQRRDELEALVADIESGQTLTKKDVLSRLGKPDADHLTGSKDYADRIILTTYRYDLPPGEYLFATSERADFGPGWSAQFVFDERVRHGRRGRLFSEPDDSTPLPHIVLYDNCRSRWSYMFPARERVKYDLAREKKE